ncbi:hypothetical protein M0657_010250, partial [Pyricularia oryzae]
DSPVVHKLGSGTFKLFIESLCNLQSQTIWVLPAAHSTVNTTEAAMVQGLVCTVSMEDRALDITLLEAVLGVSASGIAFGIQNVAESLADCRKGGSTGLDADKDYSIQGDGTIHISRMKWVPLPEQIVDTSRGAKFRDDAPYLLGGGMEGLGGAVATWIAEQGPRHFVFLLRSVADPRNEPFVQELRSYPGGSVITISGDVGYVVDSEQAHQFFWRNLNLLWALILNFFVFGSSAKVKGMNQLLIPSAVAQSSRAVGLVSGFALHIIVH